MSREFFRNEDIEKATETLERFMKSKRDTSVVVKVQLTIKPENEGDEFINFDMSMHTFETAMQRLGAAYMTRPGVSFINLFPKRDKPVDGSKGSF